MRWPERAAMTDGLLVLGFGGPTPGCCGRRATCPKTPGCEAECFVAGILGDNPARAARIAEVAGHYHHFGGFSPYNALTERQQRVGAGGELANEAAANEQLVGDRLGVGGIVTKRRNEGGGPAHGGS